MEYKVLSFSTCGMKWESDLWYTAHVRLETSMPVFRLHMLTLITFLCDSLERFHDSSSALKLNLLFPRQVPEQIDLTGPAWSWELD